MEVAKNVEDDPTNEVNFIDETVEMPPPGRSHKRIIKKGTDGFWSHNILKHPSVVARAVRNKVTPTALASITESLIEATGGDPSKVDLSYSIAYRHQNLVVEKVAS